MFFLGEGIGVEVAALGFFGMDGGVEHRALHCKLGGGRGRRSMGLE